MAIKTLFLVGCLAILVLEVTKRQTLLPSMHESCLMPRLAYPILILNIVSAILSSQSRDIGIVFCRGRIGHTHLTHSYILKKDIPPQCERCQYILTVRHILVECNHFAKKGNYIWWERCCGIIPPHTHFIYFKECHVYNTF